MNRSVVLGAAAAALASCLVVAGTVEAGAHAPSGPVAPSTHGSDPAASFTVGLKVRITNDSTHDLIWSGDQKGHLPTYEGPSVLRPGQTTYFNFEQSSNEGGLTTFPSWRVGSSGKFIYPGFSVPLVGFNGYVCTANEIDRGSPAKLTGCSIGSGYSPTATVVVKDI